MPLAFQVGLIDCEWWRTRRLLIRDLHVATLLRMTCSDQCLLGAGNVST